MTTRAIVGALAAATLLAGCGFKYKMPDGKKVRGQVLCGQSPCPAGNATGRVLHLNKVPYAPAVESTTTPVVVARQIVGGIVRPKDRTGGKVFTCSLDGTWPFKEADVVALGSTAGYQATYTKTDTLRIDVQAAAQADADAIKRMGALPSSMSMAQVEAKLQAAYQSLRGSVLTVKARYYQFGLTPTATRAIFEGANYPGCTARLRDGFEIIAAAGILWMDVEYESSATSDLVASTQAEFARQGLAFNFDASVRRKAAEELKATLPNGYQVLAWRMADGSNFPDPSPTSSSR